MCNLIIKKKTQGNKVYKVHAAACKAYCCERTVVIESEKVKVKDIYGILLLFITVIIIITTK